MTALIVEVHFICIHTNLHKHTVYIHIHTVYIQIYTPPMMQFLRPL